MAPATTQDDSAVPSVLSALVSPDSLSPLLTRPEFVSVALVSADSDDSTSLLVDDDLGAPAFLPFEGDVDPVATRSLSSRRRTKRSSAARRMDLERRSDTLEVVGLPRSFDQHHLVAHHPRHQHLASAHQKRTSSSPLLNLSQPLTPRSAGRSCPSRAAFAHALDLPRRRPSHVDQDFLNSTHRRGCRCRWTSAKAERAGDASGLECDAEERKYRWDDKKLVRGGKKAAKHESEHEHGDDTPAPKKVKVAKPSHAASSSAPHASSSTNGHHSSKTHPHRPSSSAKSHKTGKGQSVSRLSTSGPAEGAGTEGTGSSPGGDGSDGGSSGAGSVPGGNGGNGGAAPQAPQPTNSPAVVAPAPNPTTAGTATVAAAGVTAPSGTSTPPGVIAVPSPSLSKIGSAASIVAPATANSVAGGSGPGLLSVLGGKSATSSAVGVSSTSPSSSSNDAAALADRAARSSTVSKAVGGSLGGLAFLGLLGLLAVFLLRRRRKRREGRESFSGLGHQSGRGLSQVGGYGATMGAGRGVGSPPMSPEEPEDLRYSATGAGLLDRLRGMTDSLGHRGGQGSPRLGASEAAAGLGVGAAGAAALGLSIGSRHDGTDPFSDAHQAHVARYGAASPVIGHDPSQGTIASDGSYLHDSNDNSAVTANDGGNSSGVEEAVQFGSASEESAGSVPQRRGPGSSTAWWGGQQQPQAS